MQIIALTTYPLKSGAPTSHERILAGPMGLEGDRRWAVCDESGVVATRRELPQLARLNVASTADGLRTTCDGISLEVPVPVNVDPVAAQVFSTRFNGVLDAGDAAAGFVSEALGQPLRLVYFPDAPLRPVSVKHGPEGHYTAFADGYPILIATEASRAALNAALGEEIAMRRFRPNIVVDGDFAPWSEDKWVLIRAGGALLRIVKPCERCVMTTQDPDTGERLDPREPLYTLGKLHRSARGKIIFGQNAIVEEAGVLRLGDAVEVVETGPSNLL
ncbi:MOSC domain-containing protein [Celeribacter sp.]|uniref:MOSC domain-containing protein n=1 Tax=Celeribacter sp. TaxID=1890673 RepID=UPI003A92EA65